MKKIKLLMVALFAILALNTMAQGIDSARKKTEKQKTEKKSYACPMHAGVVSNKPGKCPTCNMELKEVKKEKVVYACPSHPEITGKQPGKCSKCGKELMLSPKEKMKMEVMHKYACPMHPDVTSDKPGNCSKCGMALKEKKEEHEHGHE